MNCPCHCSQVVANSPSLLLFSLSLFLLRWQFVDICRTLIGSISFWGREVFWQFVVLESNVQSFDHVAAKSCIGKLPWKLQMPGKSTVHDDLQVLNFKLLSFVAFLLMSRTWCGTVKRMHPSSAWNFQVQILSLRLTIFLTFPSGPRLATQSVAKDEDPRVFASFEDMSFEDPHG